MRGGDTQVQQSTSGGESQVQQPTEEYLQVRNAFNQSEDPPSPSYIEDLLEKNNNDPEVVIRKLLLEMEDTERETDTGRVNRAASGGGGPPPGDSSSDDSSSDTDDSDDDPDTVPANQQATNSVVKSVHDTIKSYSFEIRDIKQQLETSHKMCPKLRNLILSQLIDDGEDHRRRQDDNVENANAEDGYNTEDDNSIATEASLSSDASLDDDDEQRDEEERDDDQDDNPATGGVDYEYAYHIHPAKGAKHIDYTRISKRYILYTKDQKIINSRHYKNIPGNNRLKQVIIEAWDESDVNRGSGSADYNNDENKNKWDIMIKIVYDKLKDEGYVFKRVSEVRENDNTVYKYFDMVEGTYGKKLDNGEVVIDDQAPTANNDTQTINSTKYNTIRKVIYNNIQNYTDPTRRNQEKKADMEAINDEYTAISADETLESLGTLDPTTFDSQCTKELLDLDRGVLPEDEREHYNISDDERVSYKEEIKAAIREQQGEGGRESESSSSQKRCNCCKDENCDIDLEMIRGAMGRSPYHKEAQISNFGVF